MEEESKVQEFAESEPKNEVASEPAAEPESNCKCQPGEHLPGHLKPHKCHKCRFVIICAMLLLQIVTLGLLVDMRCHMKHRMRRFGDFRPPIHRFEEDSLHRGHRGGIKISVSEEPAGVEEPEHEQRPEMEHEGVSDMHDQADPDMQAM